jgi:hypothetical protein
MIARHDGLSRQHVIVRLIPLWAIPCIPHQNKIVSECNKGKLDDCMPTPKLTNEIINAAILGFEEQKRNIDAQLRDLRAMLSGAPVETAILEAAKPARRKVSAAGREKMALAQKKRWAAKKAGATLSLPVAKKAKGGITDAGRAALAAAMKKRWAAKRSAEKK